MNFPNIKKVSFSFFIIIGLNDWNRRFFFFFFLHCSLCFLSSLFLNKKISFFFCLNFNFNFVFHFSVFSAAAFHFVLDHQLVSTIGERTTKSRKLLHILHIKGLNQNCFSFSFLIGKNFHHLQHNSVFTFFYFYFIHFTKNCSIFYVFF